MLGTLSIPSTPVCKAVYTSNSALREGRRSEQRRRKRGEERDRAVKPLPCTPSPWTERIPPIVQQDPPPKVYERTRGPPVPRMDPARFSADPTHSVPIRPIRCILTRAHEPRQRASERTNERSGRPIERTKWDRRK